MKFIAFITLLGFATGALAAPDQIRSKSPEGKFTAVFQRNSDKEDYRLNLIERDGKIRFQSDPIDLAISEGSIIWNSTGDALAFSAGTSFLMTAFILTSHEGEYSLKRAPSPKGGWDNFHQTPEKWSKGLLTVRIDGPHAGKARDYHYEGTMTIDTSKQFRVVSENINTVEQGAAASSPYLKATSEWACVLKQSGKDDFEREIYGVDALQAVINSLFMLQTFIEQYRHKGHSVLYLGSDDELDISTYFSVFSLNKAEQGAAANP